MPIKPSNPLSTISRRNASDCHAYWVYEDKDFQIKFSVLMKFVSSNQTRIGINEPNDPAVVRFNHLTNDIMTDFCLPAAYLNKFMNNTYEYVDFNNTVKAFEYRSSDDTIIVHFRGSTNSTDYKNSWRCISQMINLHVPQSVLTTTRIATTADTQLIYSVFRARKKLTFKEIYDLYRQGSLSGYEGKPTNQFAGLDAFQRHYNRYKPTAK